MNRIYFYTLGAIFAVLTVFGGCGKQAAQQADRSATDALYDPHYTHADSLLQAALGKGEYQRMPGMIDSLFAAGQLNDFRADGYRAYAYGYLEETQKAIACLRRALEEDHPTDSDYVLVIHLKTLYAELQEIQGNSEGAMRTAMPVLDQLRRDGHENDYVAQRLYTAIGLCKLNLEHYNDAAQYYEKVYSLIKESIKNDSTGEYIVDALMPLYNITGIYFDNKMLDEDEKWLNRLDSVATLAMASPLGTTQAPFIESYTSAVKLFRAMIADEKGNKDEAQRYYKEFQTTDYAKSTEGRLNSCIYLLNTHQYNEAADNFALLDKLMLQYGLVPNLKNIGDHLMPKLRANFHAGRRDSALRVAMQIAEMYDSALVNQRRDETAELATIYDVEGKDRMIAEREAKIAHQRFVGVLISLIGLTLFFVVFTWLRHRAAKRLAELRGEKERIASELRIARDIQMSMVPGMFPQREGLDMYAMMEPAREVGGDLYGFLKQGDKLYFCVGDVSGKGVPASLFMAQATRLFQTLAAQNMMPDEIVTRINDALSGEDNVRCMFVTFFLGLLDLKTGHLDYCNAGHNAPIISDSEHHGGFLDVASNAPIGPMPGMTFKGQEIESLKGRTLFIYTDGLNEAENMEQKQMGNARMLELVNEHLEEDARQMIEGMTAEVKTYRDGAEPSDDLTMMCIKLEG
ncbi:MAG: serine/threonine-protein phosphatase [Prevotella sp.]|nr:serine/threonine-protein phosphatase [Prevotella sp.]